VNSLDFHLFNELGWFSPQRESHGHGHGFIYSMNWGGLIKWRNGATSLKSFICPMNWGGLHHDGVLASPVRGFIYSMN
jgi:hypothetical protein